MRMNRATFIALIEQNVPSANLNKLNLDTRLADVGIDSLGLVTLLFSIESAFNIKIDDKDLEGLNGQSSMAQFISTFRTLGYEIEV